MSESTIKGRCHCGNIRFELNWPGDGERIAARQCGCTFCKMREASWTSHPGATLVADVEDKEQVSAYRFGTKTADFHVCSVCGVVPFVTSDIDGNVYAVVNIAAFEANDSRTFDVSGTDFDGEDEDNRLTRRQQNWIGDVSIRGFGR